MGFSEGDIKMTQRAGIILGLVPLLALLAYPVRAEVQPTTTSTTTYYNYAHNDAEYSVKLPEAPTVETIWGGVGPVPYLDKVPSDGPLGEIATFKRIDIETEDSFFVKVTFLKVSRSFLEDLTEKKLKTILESKYKDFPLNKETFTFSAGTDSLKWATLTGFTLDKNNSHSFNAIHYLTGQQTILVLEVVYSIENKLFQEYYQNLIDSIKYHPI